MTNPVGYLYRVGSTAATRRRGRWNRTWAIGDVPVETADVNTTMDLERALATLRPHHRAAVMLVHCHGHTYEEAAEVLGVPVTTVTNHVSRGLRQLRDRLGKESGDD